MRDSDGLIKGIEHPRTPEGFVNWRALINEEHLYPNKDWFENRNLDVPESVEGLEDNQLVIKLSGLKELASIRGFVGVDTVIERVRDDYVNARCTIHWAPNYETDDEIVSYTANCGVNPLNADAFSLKFLEATAENRAFTRCVRNFLKIHIVGDEELSKAEPAATQGTQVYAEPKPEVSKLSGFGPYSIFQAKALEKGLSNFDLIKGWLRVLYKNEVYRNEEVKDWKQIEDIPVKELRILMKHLSEEKE